MDPRLSSALAIQLEEWRRALRSGAERVGWKLGIGDRERIGPGPVIGHLTSATLLVDLGSPPDDPESIVAANVFHRAFALGPPDHAQPPDVVTGSLIVRQDERERRYCPGRRYSNRPRVFLVPRCDRSPSPPPW